MILTRVIGTVIFCCWGAFSSAQVTDPRQMQVPAPPFVVSSPAVLSPEALLSADTPTEVRNLTPNPIQITVTRTLTGKGIPTLIPETSRPDPIPPWGTLKLINGTTMISLKTEQLIKSDAVSDIFLNVRVVLGTYAFNSRIPVAYLTAAGATTLLSEWKIKRVGDMLDHDIVPIAEVAKMSCTATAAGWLQGDSGALQVMAKPGLSRPAEAADPDAGPSQVNATCDSLGIASRVIAVQLSLRKWPLGNLETGQYAGTLTMPVKGEDTAHLKLIVQNTWPWWLASLCILAGVLFGLICRWVSDFFTVIQRNRTDAAKHLVEAQNKANALNKPTTSSGHHLGASFSVAAQAEYDAIDKELKQERGLTRDPVQSIAIEKRLIQFREAAENYAYLVIALDRLAVMTATTQLPPSNLLGRRITDWLTSKTAPSISELSVKRSLAESYVSLFPVWLAFETVHSSASQDLNAARTHLLSDLPHILSSRFKPLALPIANDLRDTTVCLDQARTLLNMLEPTPDAATEIRSVLTRAIGALLGVTTTLQLISTPGGKQASFLTNNPSKGLNLAVVPHSGQVAAQNIYKQQRTVLGWSSASLTVFSMSLALLIGLSSLYWGKTFGLPEAVAAFIWGLGTKLGLDSLYTFIDRLIQRVPDRPQLIAT